MEIPEPMMFDWVRELFETIDPWVGAFVRQHNQLLQKWFKESPDWAIQFRHPIMGEAQIVISPKKAGQAQIWWSWWVHDYDSESGRDVWREPTAVKVSEPEIRSCLESAFEEILAWRESDLKRSYTHPSGFWKEHATKEQFGGWKNRIPFPKK